MTVFDAYAACYDLLYRDKDYAGEAFVAEQRTRGVSVAATKSSAVDVVTQVDRDCEALIRTAVADRDDEARETLRYVCELKIDGLSIALTYEDGRLVRGPPAGRADRP